MRKFGIFLGVLCLALALAACGDNASVPPQTEPKETTSVSSYTSAGAYPKAQNMLTWEGINAFPIKSSDMTIDEARSLCVDFFRYSKSALWTPSEDYKVYNDSGNVARSVDRGKLYGGLPYVGLGSGSVYRIMDYMDEKTGVVNVKAAGENPRMFGNQCSIGAWWGWARVINSANYSWTKNTTQINDFISLGDFRYDPELKIFTKDYGTDEVCLENGLNTMLEAYAQLKKGDGIVYYTTAGHTVMIASDAVVTRKADGTIDPQKSYVTVIDQASTWADASNDQGDLFVQAENVDARWTFMSLYNGDYLPFTYKEWLGQDPIEDTVWTYSHSGDTITKQQLLDSSMECNYSVSDLYASIYDKDGNEVFKIASRVNAAGRKTLAFTPAETTHKMVFTWGAWEDLAVDGAYTVKVYAQLGTGERPILWEGKFVQ